MKDEVGGNLNEEENDFMLKNHYGDDSLEELNAAVILMARIQPTDDKADAEPTYDVDALGRKSISKVECILKVIIFDDAYVDNNGGTDEHDSNAHDQFVALESLIYNELETCKERVKPLEKQPPKSLNYKEAYEELEWEIHVDKDKIDNLIKEKYKIQDEFFQLDNATVKIRHETKLSKKAFNERENKYFNELVDLQDKLSSHCLQNGTIDLNNSYAWEKPNKVYDPFLKAGLGYQNPEHLKKAIKAQPKMYDGEKLQSTKLIIDSPDYEETLEDAEESRLKMKDKIIQLNYEK
ncbi:hypothetical protein Tco_0351487 [Tanacetum coccineum]